MTARKVIIDCDPGTDDAIALFLALGSPELDVVMVTAVGADGVRSMGEGAGRAKCVGA